jgi:CRP-like cAMP-binding protein
MYTLLNSPPVIETEYKFNRRSLLPLRVNELWQIKSGVVRTFTWGEDGNVIHLGLWGAGDIIGKPLSKANPYTIECMTPVEAQLLPVSQWDKIIPALIEHNQRLEEFLELRQCKPMDIALLKLLTWLSKRFGRAVAEGQLIDLRLTHQELAEMIGSNRVTVTRMLNNFEKQGLICRGSRSVIVVPETTPLWHYEI